MTPETLLLRQIHPAFVDNGQVSSQAFRPTPKDEQQLSVYDGDMILPPASWDHYTSVLRCQSAGVMAVTVAECEELKLPARPDPTPFPEHAVIDFVGLSKGQTESKGKKLRDRAVAKGWLFGPK